MTLKSSTPIKNSLISKLVILIPCYNENQTIILFLESLMSVVSKIETPVTIIVVDDHSADETLEYLNKFGKTLNNNLLHLLPLKVHVGQQGAIQEGLRAVCEVDASHILVMDGDGEDKPETILDLLKHSSYDIVHATRGRRHEGAVFQISYFLYRLIFRLITRRTMDFGNFSLIRSRILVQLLQSPLLNFAARLRKAEGTRISIRVDRGYRLGGESKMRFQGLIYHAFHSLLEFSDDLLMVFFKIFVLNVMLFFGATGFILYHKFITGRAISGWTSILGIGLLNLAMISFGVFVLGILITSLKFQIQTPFKDVHPKIISLGKN